MDIAKEKGYLASRASATGDNVTASRDFKEKLDLLENLEICGVMGMATFTENEQIIRHEFNSLKTYFEAIKSHFESHLFDTISMGMSGDYQIAIREGSTSIRVGTAIFGPRA